jgi:hypothetical protein
MTPLEIAQQIANESTIIGRIARAIAEAVIEEREACADLAERVRKRERDRKPYAPACTVIAEEIRDRILMRPATTSSDWTSEV